MNGKKNDIFFSKCLILQLFKNKYFKNLVKNKSSLDYIIALLPTFAFNEPLFKELGSTLRKKKILLISMFS
jgi:hypothetical protein